MRARNIKPGFFKNEQLLKCEPLARILFEGLWCMADREGRLEDRPFQIKIEVLPCDNCDVNILLQQLHDNGLVLRYEIDGKKLIQVLTFTRHQNPHVKEKPSTLSPHNHTKPDTSTRQAPDKSDTDPDLGSVQHPLNPESCFLNPESSISGAADAVPDDDAVAGGPKIKSTKYPLDFESFWAAYPPPRRTEKPEALKAWRVAIRKETPEKIIDGLLAYCKTREATTGYAPRPAKWLKNERWDESAEQFPATSPPRVDVLDVRDELRNNPEKFGYENLDELKEKRPELFANV